MPKKYPRPTTLHTSDFFQTHKKGKKHNSFSPKNQVSFNRIQIFIIACGTSPVPWTKESNTQPFL